MLTTDAMPAANPTYLRRAPRINHKSGARQCYRSGSHNQSAPGLTPGDQGTPRLTPPAAARGSTRLALRSARRVVGRQLFSALLDRLGVDQDERKDGGLRALGDPGVHRAALHADVARLHRHRAAVVKFEVAFALEADRVVEGLGAVHELLPARCELDHPTHAALARADVIVADDKALALQLGGRIRVVDRHLVGRPDVDARDARPPAAPVPAMRSSVATTALPRESCPVTIRRTSSAMAFLL